MKTIRLDPENVDFIEGGVSIVVASRDEADLPTLALALGCRVLARGGRVRVFLAEPYCRALVQGIRRSGNVAAVFSRPNSNRTIQLKGAGAQVRALVSADAPLLAAYVDKLAANLVGIGMPAEMIRTVMAADKSVLVAVEFAPDAAFSQTPGPLAGSRLQT